MAKWIRRLSPLLGLVLFTTALWVLSGALKQYHYHDVLRHVRALPLQRLLLAMALTLASYFVLSGYDVLGIRYAGKSLPYARVLPVSFIGSAFSQNIGFSVLSGGSVRLRLYTAAGLSGGDVARIIGFCSLSFWLGFLLSSGALFVSQPLHLPVVLHLPVSSLRPLGVVFLLVVASYLGWSALRRPPIKIRGYEVSIPPPALALPQVVVAAADWSLAAGVLYVLLPTSHVPFLTLMALYLLAQVSGVLSQVPGGLGVFEGLMVVMLAPYWPASTVLGSLLTYRVIYYLVPLAVAAVALAGSELLQRRAQAAQAGAVVARWYPLVAPHLFAAAGFLAGAVLLFSGAVPGVRTRLEWVNQYLHFSIMEASHFLASLVGVGLILLARGLQRRLDGAWAMSCILLSLGIVLSLLKGGDYEEAVTLSFVLAALLASRAHFYRKASLLNAPFTAGWVVAITMVLVASVWLGLFAFQHVTYSRELWWQFELSGDAPRFLRGTVAAVGGILFFSTVRLLKPAVAEPGKPSPEQLALARTLAMQSPKSNAHLAMIGDKTFLVSEKKTGFLMYGEEGRSLVSMGDPVGPPQVQAELAWKFRELCDRHDHWTVFYQVDADNLPLYVDLGLTLLKLGEEARVPLTDFSLEGPSRRSLRQAHNRMERDGYKFSVIPAEQVSKLMPEVKVISDAWLGGKNVREKGFSLGYFNEQYLSQYPMALVHEGETLLGFANVWPSDVKEELSIDLMRFLPGAPRVMEFMFIKLMLWGRAEGYRWFNLGMAPLSGMEDRALAPLWNKLGSLVFRYGEHFYNFQGLRQYKEKFDPVWQPKFLACPGGLVIPQVLANVTSLVSRGLRGVVSR